MISLVNKYIDVGYLKILTIFLKILIFQKQIKNKYGNLNSWIQWVSFYSGKI